MCAGNLTSDRADEACRVIHAYTFLASQYKAPADPIATFPLLNRSHSQAAAVAALSGSWTSYAADGTLADDGILLRPAGSAALYNGSCERTGPDPSISCSTRPLGIDVPGGTFHDATVRLNASSRLVVAVLCRTRAATCHQVEGTARSDLMRVEWSDGSAWVRYNPAQVGECCARCTAAGACRAWVVVRPTVSLDSGLLAVISSEATAG